MDEGLTGILEDAEIKPFDMVSPFIGAVIDTSCGEFDGAPVQNLFENNVDILFIVNKRKQVLV